MPGPEVHKLRRLSTPPGSQPSSLGRAPHRSLHAHPASLPSRADNAPTGSLADSTRHSSIPFLHTVALPLPASSPPVPRTSHARTALHTSLLCRSTHRAIAPALLLP